MVDCGNWIYIADYSLYCGLYWSLDCGNWSLYMKGTETLNLRLATCKSEPLKLENYIFTSHPVSHQNLR